MNLSLVFCLTMWMFMSNFHCKTMFAGLLRELHFNFHVQIPSEFSNSSTDHLWPNFWFQNVGNVLKISHLTKYVEFCLMHNKSSFIFKKQLLDNIKLYVCRLLLIWLTSIRIKTSIMFPFGMNLSTDPEEWGLLKISFVDCLLQDHMKWSPDLNPGKQACETHIKTLRRINLLNLLLIILPGALRNREAWTMSLFPFFSELAV